MKIFVTGTRGIPDIPGGIEKHCEKLFSRIADCGHQVILCTRKPYHTAQSGQWKGVKLISVFAPKNKNLETIIHTFLSLIVAKKYHPDVIHIHAIGPAILTPVARFFGFKVVVTNHGPDYERQKWGIFAKFVLKTGEKIGGIFANEVIVISNRIADIVRFRCKRDANIIFNGVEIPKRIENSEFLDDIGVVKQKYILTVARLVPEKGLHDLIEAFKLLNWRHKLVIVGDVDHDSAYSRKLKRLASDDNRIIFTGYISGKPLEQVYSHAKLFVLPSYHEGLPIVLLEAMSYKLPVLVSNIPAHKEIALREDRYFECGNTKDLKTRMENFLRKGITIEEIDNQICLIKEKYNWGKIADQTIDVYRRVVKLPKDRRYDHK